MIINFIHSSLWNHISHIVTTKKLRCRFIQMCSFLFTLKYSCTYAIIVHRMTVHCVTYISSCTLPSFFWPETFSFEYPPCTYKISSVTLTHICTPLRWRGTCNHTRKNYVLNYCVLNHVTIQYTNTNISIQIKWHQYTEIHWHVLTLTSTLTRTSILNNNKYNNRIKINQRLSTKRKHLWNPNNHSNHENHKIIF